MATVTISEEQLNKVLIDVERLIDDITLIFDLDKIAKHRLREIKTNSAIGKSEGELNNYLKQRGIKIE